MLKFNEVSYQNSRKKYRRRNISSWILGYVALVLLVLDPVIVPVLEPVIVPTLEPVIVPTLEPVIVPALDPVIVPALDPVIVPTLFFLEPVIVPAKADEDIAMVRIAAHRLV